jgi:cytochrome c biogenesis protein CcmG/thiol:disulfide interchange protein DsbE
MKRAPLLQHPARRVAIVAAGIFALLIVLSVTPSGAAGKSTPSVPEAATDALIPPAARQPASAFTLVDAQGQPVTLAQRKGKVVLLDFWATWCGGCKQEIPWYIQFDKTYRDRGLAIIGASMDDDGWKSVRPFLARKHDDETGGNMDMRYPVVIATPALAKSYNIASLPVTLLIDRQGRIALTHVGVVNRQAFEADIQTLLAQH